jgi:predicted AlkP superfamily pyrophosphatase or phosphodiesterase
MRHVALYVLLDGVGWRQAEDARLLAALCPHRRQLTTVLGYSCGAVPTILTGKLPVETGQWAMWFYAPATSPFRRAAWQAKTPEMLRRLLGITRQRIVGDYKVRRGITGYCEVYQIPDQLLPVVDTCIGKSLYLPEALTPVETIFDRWLGAGIPFRVYGYPTPDAETFRKAMADLTDDHATTYFLHLYESDSFLHRYCNDADAVRARLGEYEAEIMRFYALARSRAESVSLTIFSDHGMTNVTSQADVMGEIAALGLRLCRDYVALYDSTMARFWFLRSSAEEKIRDCLARLSSGRTIPEEELERLGIRFADRRFGHLVFLMRPGWVINPSHMGSVPPVGMHGYHPEEDPGADAALLSTRPIPDGVAHIRDLFGLLSRHEPPRAQP